MRSTVVLLDRASFGGDGIIAAAAGEAGVVLREEEADELLVGELRGVEVDHLEPGARRPGRQGQVEFPGPPVPILLRSLDAEAFGDVVVERDHPQAVLRQGRLPVLFGQAEVALRLTLAGPERDQQRRPYLGRVPPDIWKCTNGECRRTHRTEKF